MRLAHAQVGLVRACWLRPRPTPARHAHVGPADEVGRQDLLTLAPSCVDVADVGPPRRRVQRLRVGPP
eukprot:2590021-Prymnesium_polylepis.1